MAAAVDGAAGWDSGANDAWNAGSAATGGDTWNGGGTTANDETFGNGNVAGDPETKADGAAMSPDTRLASVLKNQKAIIQEIASIVASLGLSLPILHHNHSAEIEDYRHNKADCTEPRVFKGTCRHCNKEGHPARECPDKPAQKCKNCQEEGHEVKDCKANRKFDRSNISDADQETAWNALVKSDEGKDMESIRDAFAIYTKACPDATYEELEKAFRQNDFNLHLVAIEKELPKTHTYISLQGELDKKYQAGFYWDAEPKRKKMLAVWPSTPEENLERLKEAGMPMERLMPKCHRCDELGHVGKNCPEKEADVTEGAAEGEELLRPDKITIACANCSEPGHRARDCTTPRKQARGPMTCRNCGQEGHKKDDCDQPPDLSNQSGMLELPSNGPYQGSLQGTPAEEGAANGGYGGATDGGYGETATQASGGAEGWGTGGAPAPEASQNLGGW
ncbi:uncharacterized protein KY384_006154 [Bacidia gigantensis]|uniref:uncharacterized protein n=1 Tax=Bacidia gigantensis TaxID=2732470 RepID=UPI001D0572C7|nr:uncharacterized protein KY384_006154 [Bacidia gigantensis]KAG8529517.1 hypothetical protein KY384_006154 [Bacidia gigantensis]